MCWQVISPFWFLPAALRAAQTCRYLVYSEVDFEVFRPVGATRCTDGGEIWHGGGSLHAKFHPHRCNDKDVGSPKLKFLLRFDRNVGYERPAGAYPLRDFHKICRVCTSFQDALCVKILLDLLKGLWSYKWVLSWGGLLAPKFSAPPSGETMRQTPNVLEVQERARCSLSPCQVWSASDFTRRRGGQKRRVFLSVCLFVCLFVRHAFERQSLCALFRHEGVGVPKRFWCRWIGEGL